MQVFSGENSLEPIMYGLCDIPFNTIKSSQFFLCSHFYCPEIIFKRIIPFEVHFIVML